MAEQKNMQERDIVENILLEKYPGVLEKLLYDNSSKKNILWASSEYSKYGAGYFQNEEIKMELITGNRSGTIKPRIDKELLSQKSRSKDKAEVFTPSWICEKQNNLFDENWLDIDEFAKNKIILKKNKDWKNYIDDTRLEMACGEAPYLANRYDVVSGHIIPVKERIGLLDRKLRIISNFVDEEDEWYKMAVKAVQSIYAFEYQGDNVLLARENILFDIIEHYSEKFKNDINSDFILEIAEILSWNIWQMDGLKLVIPNTCHAEEFSGLVLFGDEEPSQCKGCKENNLYLHNGIRCRIMDWKENKEIEFMSLIDGRL